MSLVAAAVMFGAGCVSVGGRVTQSIVRGTAGAAVPSSEFADPPIAVEGDEISASSTSLIFDASIGVADVAQLELGYGMVFPDVRVQKPEAPNTVTQADNEFADRFTAGVSVALLSLGEAGKRDRAPFQIRVYGEVGFAAITSGLFAGAGPNVLIESGVRLASDRGFFVQAGLLWEKGGLGEEAGGYSATGLGFGVGYHYPWPGSDL